MNAERLRSMAYLSGNWQHFIVISLLFVGKTVKIFRLLQLCLQIQTKPFSIITHVLQHTLIMTKYLESVECNYETLCIRYLFFFVVSVIFVRARILAASNAIQRLETA